MGDYRFLRFPGGKAKAVTLSYDDGCKHDIRFSEIISKYGLKCTFNLCDMGKENDSWRMSKEEIIKNIVEKGHEIAVHGIRHKAEGTARPIEGIRDVLDCRLELENAFGTIIRGMAYPDAGITYFANNATYEQIKNYLTELDIVYSRTLGGDNTSFELPQDWHCWMPTAHHCNPKIMEYIDEFLKLDLSPEAYHARRAPALFYLWGHSFEFDGANNWDLLENICDKLSGHDEIWYATNIEIYDYVQAYNSLVFSADTKIIYNPTLIDVWFDIEGTLYCIKSGETLKFS